MGLVGVLNQDEITEEKDDHCSWSAFSNPQGDSGGPLLCAGVAQGIMSYVHVNAKPPAIFTRNLGKQVATEAWPQSHRGKIPKPELSLGQVSQELGPSPSPGRLPEAPKTPADCIPRKIQ